MIVVVDTKTFKKNLGLLDAWRADGCLCPKCDLPMVEKETLSRSRPVWRCEICGRYWPAHYIVGMLLRRLAVMDKIEGSAS